MARWKPDHAIIPKKLGYNWVCGACEQGLSEPYPSSSGNLVYRHKGRGYKWTRNDLGPIVQDLLQRVEELERKLNI